MKMMKYQFSAEDYEIIKDARSKNRDKQLDRRLQVLELRCEGMTQNKIAEKTGFHRSHISNLIKKYFEEGLSSISEKHYFGNRRNMSYNEEEAILAPFKELAEKGELVEISAIKTAYQSKVDHIIGENQIYCVLRRHGWRKVMPRSKHPNKASDEVIETSKKLPKRSEN